jgi:SAM-dependent methyltransferase
MLDERGPEMSDYYQRLATSQKYRESRKKRAELIADVIGDLLQHSETIVDLGSGTGLIKDHLSKRLAKPILGIEIDPDFILCSVDTCLGTVTDLPVKSGSVDLILCNHLYEHVHDRSRLFSEIKRVLSPAGRAYLTVGNRYQFMEPHYRLPLLSWCPGSVADFYLRVTRRGTDYSDIRFPTYSDLRRGIEDHGLEAEDITLEVLLRRRHRIEGPLRRALLSGLMGLPLGLRQALLRRLSPQWFLLLRRRERNRGTGSD